MASIITEVSAFVTGFTGWIGDIAETIVDQPLLMTGFIIAVTSWVVSKITGMVRGV